MSHVAAEGGERAAVVVPLVRGNKEEVEGGEKQCPPHAYLCGDPPFPFPFRLLRFLNPYESLKKGLALVMPPHWLEPRPHRPSNATPARPGSTAGARGPLLLLPCWEALRSPLMQNYREGKTYRPLPTHPHRISTTPPSLAGPAERGITERRVETRFPLREVAAPSALLPVPVYQPKKTSPKSSQQKKKKNRMVVVKRHLPRLPSWELFRVRLYDGLLRLPLQTTQIPVAAVLSQGP